MFHKRYNDHGSTHAKLGECSYCLHWGGLDNLTMIAHENIVLGIHQVRKPLTDMLSVSFFEMRNKGNGGKNSIAFIHSTESTDSKS